MAKKEKHVEEVAEATVNVAAPISSDLAEKMEAVKKLYPAEYEVLVKEQKGL